MSKPNQTYIFLKSAHFDTSGFKNIITVSTHHDQ